MTYYYREHGHAIDKPSVKPSGGTTSQPTIRDVFSILPVTYNIVASKNMSNDYAFSELLKRFGSEKSIWICKPGENANRGKGIVVLPNLNAVRNFM